MKKYYALKDPTVSAMEKRHSEISRKLAGECMVILENNGVLPLQASCNAVALYGMGARHTVKGGTGSGDVNCRCSVSVEEGLRTAGLEIRSDAWLEECDKTFENARYAYEKSLLQIAKEQNISLIAAELSNPFYRPCEPLIRKEHLTDDCEYAIYVIARDSGEGSDRKCEPGDYYLYDTEEKNIHTLTKAYKHVIVLLNVGGIIDTSFLKKEHNISAIVLIGQTGSQGGYAVSDVLTGKTMPSGKLTDTWARKYSDYPGDKSFIYQNDNVDDAYYTEGEYVGYRFFEKNHLEPAYCFGYGKGYTEFQVNVLSHHETKHAMEIRVKVKNTGDRYPGKEVVQIYYSHIGDSDCRQLAAFAKTKMLLPGQEEIMTVSVPFCQLRSFDQTERQWILKKGKYDIMVGTSWSTISETYAISMDEDIVYSSGCKTAKARPLYQDHRKEVLVFDDVRKGTATVEELVAQLTVEEMAWLCVGTERGEEDNVIGSSSMQVPGAAGETTHLLEVSRGIPSMVFSDGPAGLRLEPHFRTDGQGKILDVNQREENTEITEYYQYCTAIPIATTLAQSWDRELLKTYGKLIAEEMAQYHVHLWLAPGMNIHRNPLCGRNFEYFSEDPLLSGNCAAAEVQGVQSVKGCGATIKHFACNNQEENRMFVNAHVDEKALREIYLKGFEIAVKESQPMAIMTSYNLLNGIHTANHYELLQQICRDDWGFEGMIMTDWYTSQDVSFMGISSNKYPYSSSALCIKAGNDLQMPGCEENVEEIIHGIETGIITKADLQFCASNILRCILRLMP